MDTIIVKDQTLTGQLLREIEVAIESERTTLRDLITARVSAEVEAFNQEQDGFFNGLVQPTEAERTANGYKVAKGRKIDAEQQVYVALDAFASNGYFVLVDNRQAETLDQEVLIGVDTSISFVQLTPLVGG